MPRSFVPCRYFPISRTALACEVRGFAEKGAHWCTANANSGLVDFSRKFNIPITDGYSKSEFIGGRCRSRSSTTDDSAGVSLLEMLGWNDRSSRIC